MFHMHGIEAVADAIGGRYLSIERFRLFDTNFFPNVDNG